MLLCVLHSVSQTGSQTESQLETQAEFQLETQAVLTFVFETQKLAQSVLTLCLKPKS